MTIGLGLGGLRRAEVRRCADGRLTGVSGIGSASDRGRRIDPGPGADVVGREVEHALVDGAGLVRLIRGEQRVGERDVGLDQPGAIVGAKGVLDALLVMSHHVGLEARDLFGERRREIQIAERSAPAIATRVL